LAATTDRAELLGAACAGAREALDADAAWVETVDVDGDARVVARSGGTGEPATGADEAVPGPRTLVVPVVDGEAEGRLRVRRAAPFAASERRLLERLVTHLDAALATAALLERLRDEHLVRELLDTIATGRGDRAAARARAAGLDPDRPHVVVVCEPLARAAAWEGAE
ncbi:hypothetical protein ACVU7I_19815, partial [Patulibacter sp. S7RM1-6]